MAQVTRSSAPSSHLQMPHVFVIPPEEEQQDNPPWCCFDADEQPENNGDFPSNPDIHFLDVPYLLQPFEHIAPLPVPRRTILQPRPRALVPKKLEKKQRPEAIKIVESRQVQARQIDAREDSDVIEVVKVKRTREALTDLEENPKIKRSRTLKARATKALQSIKNVGKGSHKTHVKDLWASTESMPVFFKGMQQQFRSQQDHIENCSPIAPPSPKRRTLSRGSSRSFSQILQPVKPLQSESTFTVRVETSVTLADPHHVPSSANPASLHLKHDNTNPVPMEIPGIVMPERPVSPSPVKKHTNTRFSVRELHRLFSFSSSSPDDPPSTPTLATVPSSAPGSSMPSSTSTRTLSSDYPDVPMEGDVHHGYGSAVRKLASRYHRAPDTRNKDDPSTRRRPRDLDFEMKLESLHFDALSFDPEDFDVSMEGNVLR